MRRNQHGQANLAIRISVIRKKIHLRGVFQHIVNSINHGKQWLERLYLKQVSVFIWIIALFVEICSIDSRLMFNFIDANTDSRVSYLEFRSWMLIIDQTLAEHELLQLFNEIDRNSMNIVLLGSFMFE